MKPVNLVLLSCLFAIGGTWVQKKTISVPMVIGGAFVSLAIVVLDDAAPELAKNFAWLITASVIGAYGQDVFSMVGNMTTGGKAIDPNQAERVPGKRGTG